MQVKDFSEPCKKLFHLPFHSCPIFTVLTGIGLNFHRGAYSVIPELHLSNLIPAGTRFYRSSCSRQSNRGQEKKRPKV